MKKGCSFLCVLFSNADIVVVSHMHCFTHSQHYDVSKDRHSSFCTSLQSTNKDRIWLSLVNFNRHGHFPTLHELFFLCFCFFCCFVLHTDKRFISQLSDQIYRLLLCLAFAIYCACANFVPVVGLWWSIVCVAWLQAFYCFEYVWALKDWPLERQLLFF